MTLLDQVEAFLENTGTPPTAFSRAVAGDPRLVFDMRGGREPRQPLRGEIVARIGGWDSAPSVKAKAPSSSPARRREERQPGAVRVESKVAGLLREGVPVTEIANRLGLCRDHACKVVRKVSRREGIPVPSPRLARGEAVRELPFGVTEASRKLRGALGNQLAKLDKLPRDEVAALTGVHCDGQRLALNRQGFHDWKLSQIERLAEATGTTLAALLIEGIR